MEESRIERAITYITKLFQGNGDGHDLAHSLRVYKNALMIADTAVLSSSPIVLIDEIENAGIDRKKALDLLISQDKIVLMATHDPLLALMADKRIVIKNGGIDKIIETTAEEKEVLVQLNYIDGIMQESRKRLRAGMTLEGDICQEITQSPHSLGE